MSLEQSFGSNDRLLRYLSGLFHTASCPGVVELFYSGIPRTLATYSFFEVAFQCHCCLRLLIVSRGTSFSGRTCCSRPVAACSETLSPPPPLVSSIRRVTASIVLLCFFSFPLFRFRSQACKIKLKKLNVPPTVYIDQVIV